MLSFKVLVSATISIFVAVYWIGGPGLDIELVAFRFRVTPEIALVMVLELPTTATPSIVRFAC